MEDSRIEAKLKHDQTIVMLSERVGMKKSNFMGQNLFRSLLIAAAALVPLTAKAAVRACAPMAPMPREITIGSRYASADRTFSTIDPEKLSQQTEYRKRFGGPLRTIMAAANRAEANGEQEADMACMASYFESLAKSEAMEGANKELDNIYRSWTISSLGVIYLRFQDRLDTYPGADAVHQWFERSGRDLIRQYEPRMQQGVIDNHLYWGGEAVTVIGAVNRQPEFSNFGAAVLRAGIAQIGRDGTLPAESGRGKRALHYHKFAALPLVAITLINPNTRAIARSNNDGLARLINTVAQSYADPTGGVIAAKTAPGQVLDTNLSDLRVLKYYPDIKPESRALIERLTAGTPHYNQYLGGNLDFILNHQ